MNIAVISYSFTGNNEALARSVAKALSAEYIRISEAKPRTLGRITFDMIFDRIPLVQPKPEQIGKYDIILFFGPYLDGESGHTAPCLFRVLEEKSAKVWLPFNQWWS